MSSEDSTSEARSVESKISPPPLTCPRCEGLLPSVLGEISCLLCGARITIDHEPTRREWADEKLSCPECNKIVVVGLDKRPCNIRCSACQCEIEVKVNVPKTEIECPDCERRLRLRTKPGTRKVTCPACDTQFEMTG